MPTASQVLLEEHEKIRAIVDPALQAGEDLSLRGAPVFPDHRAALLALADVLVGDLSRHAAKEDEILFPAIEAALGSSQGPTAVMRAEHRGIHACGARYRQLLAGLRLDGPVGAKASGHAPGPDAETASVTAAAAQALAEQLRELGDLIGVHFDKEEAILFPLAESLLPLEEQLALGARLETYTIAGVRGSGVVGINGAAARLVHPGDVVILIAYGQMETAEAKEFQPRVVFVDAGNRIVGTGSDPAEVFPEMESAERLQRGDTVQDVGPVAGNRTVV